MAMVIAGLAEFILGNTFPFVVFTLCMYSFLHCTINANPSQTVYIGLQVPTQLTHGTRCLPATVPPPMLSSTEPTTQEWVFTTSS